MYNTRALRGPQGGPLSHYFFIKMFQINLCFNVLNKLEFPITIVCLRPISLNQRILQWTLSNLIKNTLKNSMFEPIVFVTKMISKKKKILWCVKHLDATIFLVCLRPIFPYFFIRLIFIRVSMC